MTQLDGNAICEIERLVRESEAIIVPDQEPRGVYYIRQPDGNLERVRAELDPQGFTVLDLDSMARAIDDARTEETATDLFVGDSEVVLVQTDMDITHRWRVTLPLPTHPAFGLISGWTRPTTYTQKELLRVLRTQLPQYVDATVVATLAALKFTDNREGSAQVGPSSSGLSRTVQQKVSGENGTAVPEYLMLTPPVYDISEDRTERYEVKVYLEYDFEQGQFVLVAVSDDVRRARERAVQKIINHLRGVSGGLTVLYGTPK